MGCMNECGNESMNASESSSITHNPFNQQNFPFHKDNQNVDLINQIFSLSEQNNFNINSFENQMEHLINQNFSLSEQENFNFNPFENQIEHQNSTDFLRACYVCSNILKTDMPCLQLSENCRL